MKLKEEPDFSALPAPVGAEADTGSIWTRIRAIFQSGYVLNGLMVTAITVGFFHGWLKIRFPNPLTTFLFDGLLCVALALVFFRRERGERFIPRGRVGSALKTFYVVCAFYGLLPLGPPLIVNMAAFRGWCFATLMYSLGFNMTRYLAQVKGYFYVLIILGVITAGYGLRQSPAEIERRMAQDEHFAERYKQTYYAQGGGKRQLRIFSTFISSGAFGSVMAYVTVFAVVLMTDNKATKREKALLILAAIPMCYALFLTGARASFIMLLLGFVVIAWYRRNLVNFIVLPLIVLLAFRLGAQYTGGASVGRYSTLLKLEDVFDRASIPTKLGWKFMMDNPLGGGLGKSGYSVPMFLWGKTGYKDTEWVDGDLGCLMIELGFVGLVFFGRIVWAALRTIFESLQGLRDTPISSVGLACAACYLMSLASFPIGAPFLGIPMGSMTWFFLGTLHKLSEGYQRGAFRENESVTPKDQLAKRFLFAPAKNQTRRNRSGQG
jgi:hypothetical protein